MPHELVRPLGLLGRSGHHPVSPRHDRHTRMSEVFLCLRGQLNDVGKHDLRKAGVVVVEVDDLTACQFIRSAEIVSGNDMLWAAMDALSRNFGYGDQGAKQREQLAMNLFQIVRDARKPAAPKQASGANP